MAVWLSVAIHPTMKVIQILAYEGRTNSYLWRSFLCFIEHLAKRFTIQEMSTLPAPVIARSDAHELRLTDALSAERRGNLSSSVMHGMYHPSQDCMTEDYP